MTQKPLLAKLFCIILLYAYPALAQNEVFVIENIQIYGESMNLENAKSEAINNGIAASFETLLHRILPAEKRWRIKTLKDEAYRVVRNIEITKERMTAFSYLGDATFTYDEVAIKSLLNKSGVFFLHNYAPPKLVIPILKSGGQHRIWEDEDWESAWGSMPSTVGLLKVRYTMGDLTDEALLDPSKVPNSKFTDFAQLVKRYDVAGLIIVVAEQKNNNIVVTLRHLSAEDDTSTTFSIAVPKNTSLPTVYQDIAVRALEEMDGYYKHYDNFAPAQ